MSGPPASGFFVPADRVSLTAAADGARRCSGVRGPHAQVIAVVVVVVVVLVVAGGGGEGVGVGVVLEVAGGSAAGVWGEPRIVAVNIQACSFGG